MKVTGLAANTVGFEPGAGCVRGRLSSFFTAANFMTAFNPEVLAILSCNATLRAQQQPYSTSPCPCIKVQMLLKNM